MDTYEFTEPLLDLRHVPEHAEALAAELRRELSSEHWLCDRSWSVIARALPQDDILVIAGTEVALVHLTWSGMSESPPWPTTHVVGSAQELEDLIELRY